MILISLLPQSEDSKLKAIDLAYEKRVVNLKKELEVVSTLAQPKFAVAKYLPCLAHTYQVPFWSNNLSEDEKRAIIDSSILLHRKKGTVWAVIKVFEALNMQANIQEWFEYDGEPYHFKVNIESIGIAYTEDDLKRLEEYINYYKNEKSVMDEITVSASIDNANIYIGGFTQNAEIIRLELVA